MMLKTCKSTDKPPKPSKNAHRTILVEIDLFAIPAIIETPFVSSIIPEIIEFAKEISILSNFKIGHIAYEKISKILLLFKIEMIMEKITTNPPIIIIVLLESNIASERIEPKFEKVAIFFEGEEGESKCWKLLFKFEILSFLLTNLFFEEDIFNLETIPKITPTVRADKICVTSNNKPIEELANKVIPNRSNNK